MAALKKAVKANQRNIMRKAKMKTENNMAYQLRKR
jgi:hypothetical protein